MSSRSCSVSFRALVLGVLLFGVPLFGGASPAHAEDATKEGEIPLEVTVAVRADIKARELPSPDSSTSQTERFRREGARTLTPDGEELLVLRIVPELKGEGVALVALEEGIYFTVARPEGEEGAIVNGPFSWRPAAALLKASGEEEAIAPEEVPAEELPGLLGELPGAVPQRQLEILDMIFVSPDSWGRTMTGTEALGEEEGRAVKRLIARLIRQQIRVTLARDQDGGFYDDQFKHLRRFGAPGRSALLRLLTDSQEHPEVRSYAAQALGEIGDAETARELDRSMRGSRMNSRLLESIAYALARLGDRRQVDRIIENLDGRIKSNPDQAGSYFQLAQVYVRIGDRQRALELYRDYLTRSPTGPQAGLTHYNIACVLSLMGNLDEAFAELDLAIESGGVDFDWMEKDGDLANLREDPRWQEMLERRKPLRGTRRIF